MNILVNSHFRVCAVCVEIFSLPCRGYCFVTLMDNCFKPLWLTVTMYYHDGFSFDQRSLWNYCSHKIGLYVTHLNRYIYLNTLYDISWLKVSISIKHVNCEQVLPICFACSISYVLDGVLIYLQIHDFNISRLFAGHYSLIWCCSRPATSFVNNVRMLRGFPRFFPVFSLGLYPNNVGESVGG